MAMSNMKFLMPLLGLLIGLIAISLAPIFVRFSLTEIGPLATIFNRFWIAALIFSFWQGIKMIRREYSEEDRAILTSELTPQSLLTTISSLLIVGILFTAIQLFWAWSLTQTSVVSSVTILHGLRPLLTTIGGWLLFKKSYDYKFLLGMVVAILGSLLIGVNDFSDSFDKLQGDLLSALSAICSALELLMMERLLTQFKTKVLLLWCCIIGFVLTFILLAYLHKAMFPVSWEGWLSVIALALLSEVIGHGLITYSLNYLSSGTVAVTMLLDPIIKIGRAHV